MSEQYKFLVQNNQYAYFYPKNVCNDYFVLMQYGNHKITTKQSKIITGKVLTAIKQSLSIMTVIDPKYGDYQTALSVAESLYLALQMKNSTHPPKQALKITINVVAELGVLDTASPLGKQSIRILAEIVKAMIGD